MASPVGEDNLEDVPIDDFKGVTLRLDPASGQPSRSVSPSGPDVPSSGSTSHRWLNESSSLRLIVLLNGLSERGYLCANGLSEEGAYQRE